MCRAVRALTMAPTGHEPNGPRRILLGVDTKGPKGSRKEKGKGKRKKVEHLNERIMVDYNVRWQSFAP